MTTRLNNTTVLTQPMEKYVATIVDNQTYDTGFIFNLSYNTVKVFLACVILATNTTTLFAIWQNKHLKQNRVSIYVISLSVADMCVGVTIIFGVVLDLVGIWRKNIHLMSEETGSKRLAGILLGILYAQGVASSMFSLLAIAVDRFFAVAQPIIYKNRFTSCSTKLTVIGIWMYNLCLGASIMVKYGCSASDATVLRADSAFDLLPTYMYVGVIIVHFIAYIVLSVIMYLATFLALRKHALSMGCTTNRTDQKMASTRRVTRL